MVQTAQIWYSDWVYIVKGNDKVKTQNLSIFDPRHDVIVEYRGQLWRHSWDQILTNFEFWLYHYLLQYKPSQNTKFELLAPSCSKVIEKNLFFTPGVLVTSSRRGNFQISKWSTSEICSTYIYFHDPIIKTNIAALASDLEIMPCLLPDAPQRGSSDGRRPSKWWQKSV